MEQPLALATCNICGRHPEGEARISNVFCLPFIGDDGQRQPGVELLVCRGCTSKDIEEVRDTFWNRSQFWASLALRVIRNPTAPPVEADPPQPAVN